MNIVWTRLLCCFSKGLQKCDFLDIYLKRFSESVISRIQQLWGPSFFWKFWKFYLHLKNTKKKKLEKKFSLLEIIASQFAMSNCLLGRQYFWSAVNVLKKSPEILPTLRETFSNLIAFTMISKSGKSSVIQISALFDPIYHVTCWKVLSNATF